jgi:hypothetical protein
MTKCANCSAAAIVEYPISGDTRILYCEKHIPAFLLKPAYKGRLNYNINVPAPVVEKVVEEAVVEEPSKKKSFKTSTEETPTPEQPAEAEGE